MPHVMKQLLTLSIVIPAPSNTAALEETLLSVLENRPDDCEVVVALGCDYDDPWNIAEEVRFVRAPVGAGIVTCINAGIAETEGEIIHVLAAGWRATPGWTDAARARFASPSTGVVTPLGIDAADAQRVVSVGIRYCRGGRRVPVTKLPAAVASGGSLQRPAVSGRVRHPVVGPVLEAGFWRASLVRGTGLGFSAVCGDRLADADKALELAAAGTDVVVEPGSRVVASGTDAVAPWERGFRGGLHGERLFWRSLAGRSLTVSLVAHGWEIVRHAVVSAPLRTVPMLLGRLLAALQFGAYLPRYRQLVALTAGTVSVEVPAGMDSAPPATELSVVPEMASDASEAGRTIRLDEGRDGLGGPLRKPRGVEPLRKSA
ncbi:MAG: glycosyltransferase family 2 protein [Planctomycetota bacterium]|nr:MAG: glycosyltransferase family 2 protein [Planctomycetota bacterium]